MPCIFKIQCVSLDVAELIERWFHLFMNWNSQTDVHCCSNTRRKANDGQPEKETELP